MAGAADFHIAFVAVDEPTRPIGLAHVLFHRSTWSPTWYCYLEDLFVDPGAARKGIGRALIEAIYREADARGCTRTYWTTQEFNYRGARALRPGGDQVAVRAVSAIDVESGVRPSGGADDCDALNSWLCASLRRQAADPRRV